MARLTKAQREAVELEQAKAREAKRTREREAKREKAMDDQRAFYELPYRDQIFSEYDAWLAAIEYQTSKRSKLNTDMSAAEKALYSSPEPISPLRRARLYVEYQRLSELLRAESDLASVVYDAERDLADLRERGAEYRPGWVRSRSDSVVNVYQRLSLAEGMGQTLELMERGSERERFQQLEASRTQDPAIAEIEARAIEADRRTR